MGFQFVARCYLLYFTHRSPCHGLAKDVHPCDTEQRMPSHYGGSIVTDRIWLEWSSGLNLPTFVLIPTMPNCPLVDRDVVLIYVSCECERFIKRLMH